MKKCPYCAEEIQDEAIKCRFCGEFLKKRWWKNCFFNCLIISVIVFIMFVLFIYLSFAMFKIIIYKMFFAGANSGHSYPPFTGQGVEGLMREFSEAFKALWEKVLGFFRKPYVT